MVPNPNGPRPPTAAPLLLWGLPVPLLRSVSPVLPPGERSRSPVAADAEVSTLGVLDQREAADAQSGAPNGGSQRPWDSAAWFRKQIQKDLFHSYIYYQFGRQQKQNFPNSRVLILL